jgi:hypothetical protein
MARHIMTSGIPVRPLISSMISITLRIASSRPAAFSLCFF